MKLIKIEEEFYIVDESKIQEGDSIIHFSLNNIPDLVTTCYSISGLGLKHKETIKYVDLYQPIGQYKKITHSTQDLSSVIKLDKSEIIKVFLEYRFKAIHSFAFDEALEQNKSNGISVLDLIPMYIKGFDKAIELTKDNLYTLEDMKQCFHAGGMYCATEGKVYSRSDDFETHIKSLQHKTQWHITN